MSVTPVLKQDDIVENTLLDVINSIEVYFASVKIQSHIRGHLERKEVETLRSECAQTRNRQQVAATRIQTARRRTAQMYAYNEDRNKIILCQVNFRFLGS